MDTYWMIEAALCTSTWLSSARHRVCWSFKPRTLPGGVLWYLSSQCTFNKHTVLLVIIRALSKTSMRLYKLKLIHHVDFYLSQSVILTVHVYAEYLNNCFRYLKLNAQTMSVNQHAEYDKCQLKWNRKCTIYVCVFIQLFKRNVMNICFFSIKNN